MTEALRHNAGKATLSQLLHFLPALEELSRHCDAGRAKYPDTDGRPNWLLGGKPDEEYLDAALRHLAAIVGGEDYDDETETLHAIAVAWNMLALVTCNHDREPTPEERTEAYVQELRAGVGLEPRTTGLAEDEYPRVLFEHEPGVLKVAYPEPGYNTFYADGGRKIKGASEMWTRAEEDGVLVYES